MAFWYYFQYFTSSVVGFVFNLLLYCLQSDKVIGQDTVVENDGDNEGEGGNLEATRESDTEEVKDEEEESFENKKPVMNIHIQNGGSGTVVVGDNSIVRYHDVSSTKFLPITVGQQEEKVCRENTTRRIFERNDDLKTKLQGFTANKAAVRFSGSDPSFGNKARDFGKKTRKKKRKINDGDSPSRKPTRSVDGKIKLIHEQLTTYRENGEWKAHEEAVQDLLSKYPYQDEENHDIVLQLNFEKAARLFARNENEQAKSWVSKTANRIDKNVDNVSDNQKIIYFRCLLLVSDIHCREKKFGKAETALKRAKKLIHKHLSDCLLLKVEYHLAQARYHYDLNKSDPNVCARNVTEETSKAEENAAGLKKDSETWKQTRRKILLTSSKAVLKLCTDDSKNSERCANMIANSLNELENQLLMGILSITKVEYFVLKCDYAKATGNFTLAMDCADQALVISKQCQFAAEERHVQQRITELQRILSLSEDGPVKSSILVEKVLNILTTDSGNLESNAAETTDQGAFSTDEFSDWEMPLVLNVGKKKLAVIEEMPDDKITPGNQHQEDKTIEKMEDKSCVEISSEKEEDKGEKGEEGEGEEGEEEEKEEKEEDDDDEGEGEKKEKEKERQKSSRKRKRERRKSNGKQG